MGGDWHHRSSSRWNRLRPCCYSDVILTIMRSWDVLFLWTTDTWTGWTKSIVTNRQRQEYLSVATGLERSIIFLWSHSQPLRGSWWPFAARRRTGFFLVKDYCESRQNCINYSISLWVLFIKLEAEICRPQCLYGNILQIGNTLVVQDRGRLLKIQSRIVLSAHGRAMSRRRQCS